MRKKEVLKDVRGKIRDMAMGEEGVRGRGNWDKEGKEGERTVRGRRGMENRFLERGWIGEQG